MMRILSVEDDIDLQRLLALALVDDDFEMRFAYTEQKARRPSRCARTSSCAT